MTESIDILLATYQGATYLPEQLDSLFSQTCQDWRILARDDGSTDGTPEILARAAAAHPRRLAIAAADGQRRGAAGSFACLLAQSEARYVMFCDQDDVWLPDKVAMTLAAMQELEREHGAQAPLLVNTDLRVVDERLAVRDESFWRFQRIHPERLRRLSRVLVQNFVTGCTTMINRPLATLAAPVPPEAVMHDWWLALVATAFGRTASIRQATALYRQHGRNDTGAVRWSVLAGLESFLFYRSRRRAARARQEEMFARRERQAAAFAARYREKLPAAELAMLEAFCSFSRRGFLGRRHLMLKHGFLCSDRWESLMALLR